MITRQDFTDCEDHPVILSVEKMTTTDILQKFCVELRHFVATLLAEGKIGNCSGNVQITSVFNFQKDEIDGEFLADSFTLKIPFAGEFLLWEIMFCHRDLLMAPDIIFNDDHFLNGPQVLNIIKKNVPSLCSWNPYDAKALLTLVQEYFTLYKKHNVQILSIEDRYSRFHFEYTSLIGEIGIEADDIEVLIEPNGVIHYLINISVDLSQLPVYVLDNHEEVYPNNNTATLLITFYRLDGSKIQPNLHLSPHVERILGTVNSKCIPPFNTQACMIDYVPEVKKRLNDRIDEIVSNHRLKNEYITYLLTMHSCSVIEYDTMTFSKITLLFKNNSFYWLLIINLDDKFPVEKPKLTARSVYHVISGSQNKPYTEQLSDYPYNPRWAPDVMVQKALTHVFENIEKFQQVSSQKNQTI